MRKVIITCAVTGAIHTPSMSPYLPVTPDNIVVKLNIKIVKIVKIVRIVRIVRMREVQARPAFAGTAPDWHAGSDPGFSGFRRLCLFGPAGARVRHQSGMNQRWA